ncbi:MAG TPA: hypothetical protein VMT45_06485 [Thermoanaerobaculaceae bacterium]|nr:hypothetical protein [Thermoanaerobaculaceae bacterium]
MLRDDPRPPGTVDTPPDALHRRCPNLAPLEAAEALYVLNALGLTCVPSFSHMLNSRMTESLHRWITPRGWKALETARIALRPD